MSLPLHLNVYLEWRPRFDDWLARWAIADHVPEGCDRDVRQGALEPSGLVKLDLHDFFQQHQRVPYQRTSMALGEMHSSAIPRLKIDH
jgi:hypothetical protein